MAAVAPAMRQPLGTLTPSRLQSLISLKNRQNALSPAKRKATQYELDDAENVNPILLATPKKSKGLHGTASFTLLEAPLSPKEELYVFKAAPVAAVKARHMLIPRSPLKIKSPNKASLSAPAGRSPPRKSAGIMHRRRGRDWSNAVTRVDPPSFHPAAGKSSFSIDSALKGTIRGYGSQPSNMSSALPDKSSWFFDIHEDTAEEECENLMNHATCTLDISSDEEMEARKKDRRGKENVPPPGDQSQTGSRPSRRHEPLAAVKSRPSKPLGEMPLEDFYGEGLDANSVFVVFDDVDDVEEEEGDEAACQAAASFAKTRETFTVYDSGE